jgi:hypothetical protein
MLTALKVMCTNNLRKRITLPTNWLRTNDRYFVITYLIDHRIKSIQIDRNDDGLEFLQENGFIDHHNSNGQMFIDKTFYISGRNGEPVEWTRSAEVDWHDIKIFPFDAIYMAAQHEYEMTGFTLGLNPRPKAKVWTADKAA